MKLRVRLAEVDRDRLGCPEWLELDPYSVSIQEAIVLQAGVDFGGTVLAYDSPDDWRAAFSAKGTSPFFATLVLVWLALRRAEAKVPLGELDFDSDDITIDVVKGDGSEPDEESGKGESVPETISG